MRRVLSLAVIVSLAALPALAQQRPQGAFGGGLMTGRLLGQESVQKELRLTEAQIKAVKELADKESKAREGLKAGGGEGFKKLLEIMKEQETAYANVLKPDQAKRLRQITLQLQGPRIMSSQEVSKELGITPEQHEKIRAIQAEAFKLSAGQLTAAKPEALAKQMQEANKKAQEKVFELFTAEQKAKWKEMTGEPFKGELQLGFPGGFRRPSK